MFGHEKFKAYQKAIEFVAEVAPLIDLSPRGQGHLADQLKRASISVPLNIAEGSGKTSNADKKRFYAIARESAMESAAILDVLARMDIVPLHSIQKPKELLNEIAGILSTVCLRK